MQDKIQAALSEGYSPAEVLNFLSSQQDFGDKVAEARAAGYGDGEILSFLSGAPQPAPERTWSEAATDKAALFGTGTGKALTGAAEAVRASDEGPAFAGPLGVVAAPLVRKARGLLGLDNVEEPVAQALEETGKTTTDYWEAQKSEARKAETQQAQARIQQAEQEGGQLSAMWQGMKEAATDPEMLVEQIPNLAIMAVLSRVGGAPLGVAGGAALQGGDVASGTREALGQLSIDEFRQNSLEFQRLVQSGLSEEEARARVTDEKSREAFTMAGAISVAANTMIPGGMAIEKALAGNALAGATLKDVALAILKGSVGEAASEATEEGLGQVVSNERVSTVDPTQPLLEGSGAAAGQGAVMGFAMGGGVNAVSGIDGLREAAQIDATTGLEFDQRVVDAAARAQLDPAMARMELRQRADEAQSAIASAATIDDAIAAFDAATSATSADLDRGTLETEQMAAEVASARTAAADLEREAVLSPPADPLDAELLALEGQAVPAEESEVGPVLDAALQAAPVTETAPVTSFAQLETRELDGGNIQVSGPDAAKLVRAVSPRATLIPGPNGSVVVPASFADPIRQAVSAARTAVQPPPPADLSPTAPNTAGAALLGSPQPTTQPEPVREVPALLRTTTRPDGTMVVPAPIESVAALTQALGIQASVVRGANNQTVVGVRSAPEVTAALQYALEPFSYTTQDQADVQLLAQSRGAKPDAITLVTPESLPAAQPTGTGRLSAADAVFLGHVLAANGRSLVLYRAGQDVGLGGAIIRGRQGRVFLNVEGNINPVAEVVHEVGHSIRDQNEGAYQTYLRALRTSAALDTSDAALIGWARANFAGPKVQINTVADAVKAVKTGNKDRLIEEFVMDATGRASREGKFWDTVFTEMQRENPSALKAFVDAFKALGEKLRRELFNRGNRFAGIERYINDIDRLAELAGRYYAQGTKQRGQNVSPTHFGAGDVVASQARIGPYDTVSMASMNRDWHAKKGTQYEIEQTPEGFFLNRVGEANGQAGAGAQPQDSGQRAGLAGGQASALAGRAGEWGGLVGNPTGRGVGSARDNQQQPQESRVAADLPGGVRDLEGRAPGSVSLVGVHFSREPRRSLNGSYFGSGHTSEEAARVRSATDPRLRSRIYLYVNEGKGVKPEAGVGSHAHAVRADNLYDVGADPLGLTIGAEPNVWEAAVLDAGFAGYYRPGAFGDQGVAILLGDGASNVPTESADQPNGVVARSGAETPLSRAKALAAKARGLKGLPAGQMPASRWRDALLGVDEEVFQAFDDAGLFDTDETLYLSELAGRYVRQVMAASPVAASNTRNAETIDDHLLKVERDLRELAETTRLSAAEKAQIKADAKKFGFTIKDVELEVRRIKSRFPPEAGWAPITFNKIDEKTLKKKATAVTPLPVDAVFFDKIAYGFHQDAKGKADKKTQAARTRTLAQALAGEILAKYTAAQSGDANGQLIMRQAGWYRELRSKLRATFGGFADYLAQLLGPTSANNPVEPNFRYATEALALATSGRWDTMIKEALVWKADMEAAATVLDEVEGALTAEEKAGLKALKSEVEARFGKGNKSDERTEHIERRVAEISPSLAAARTALKDASVYKGREPLRDNGKRFGMATRGILEILADSWGDKKPGDAPKTKNYYQNIVGRTLEATIDVWAARTLRRLANEQIGNFPRIPGPAEQGVQGNILKSGDGVAGGEFGFGQDVFREAAEELRKSGIKEFADTNASEVQAMIWFAEKELWARRDWTAKIGEGGSIEHELLLAGFMDRDQLNAWRVAARAGQPKAPETEGLAPEKAARVKAKWDRDVAKWQEAKAAAGEALREVSRYPDRFFAGATSEIPGDVPLDREMASLGREVEETILSEPGVMAVRAQSSTGVFLEERERTLDVELTARNGYDVTPLAEKLREIGDREGQHATFLSRVLRPDEQVDLLRHRPGMELYFSEAISPAAAEELISVVQDAGFIGMTLATEGRRTPEALAGETQNVVGIRVQHIPEFMLGYGYDVGMTDEQIAQASEDVARKLEDLVTALGKRADVSTAEQFYYETEVNFYGDNSRAAEGTPREARGGAWSGRSIREGLERADRFTRERGSDALESRRDRVREERAVRRASEAPGRVVASPTRNAPLAPLADAISAARLETQSAQQWKLWIANNTPKVGVDLAEVRASGLYDWLDQQGKRKLDKAELVSQIRPSVAASVTRNQTETPEFKRWFGDSKVVDEGGQPLVVYHGTRADISAFDPGAVGSNFGLDEVGFFFTSSPIKAASYADPESAFAQAGMRTTRGPEEGANIVPAYLSLQNPLTLEDYTDYFDSTPAYEIDEQGISITDYFDDNRRNIISIAQEGGHDGVLFQHRGDLLGVAFSPAQIKSATGNSGNFDPTNPDIRASVTRNQTETAAFKRWFAGSKVVDENGQPLVVYRGGNTPFEEGRVAAGFGAHFGTAQQANKAAERGVYGDVRQEGGEASVTPAFLRIKNPWRYDGDVNNWDYIYDLKQAVSDARYDGSFPLTDEQFDEGVQRHGSLDKTTPWSNRRYLEKPEQLRAILMDNGVDGVIYRNRYEGDGESYIVFSPEQIKSATGNSGNFDPTNPDIRASRTRNNVPAAVFSSPALPDTRSKKALDKVVYQFQDRFTDLKAIQASIEEAGRTIRDEFNPYMAETLMHGKAAYRTNMFMEREVEPVLGLMRRAQISVADLNKYLHARHAKERNAAMAARNPNQDELDQLIQAAADVVLDAELAVQADPMDGKAQARLIRAQDKLAALQAAKPWSGTEEERQKLSGMSNDEAQQILDRAHAGMKATAYRKLGEAIDKITAQTRAEMASYGLESGETVAAMDSAYRHYVPLGRDMEESELLDRMGGTGQGFSIRGSQVKRATGSLREVEDILANIVAAREATIVRGEKNRVAKALYGLVMEHPNPDLFTVIRPGMSEKQLRSELQAMGLDPDTVESMVKAPTQATIDEKTGLAVRRVNANYGRLENAVVLRVNGEDRVILFNKGSDRAVRLVSALRNDDSEGRRGASKFIMERIGPITRYLSAINTQYNPIFGLTNFSRDIQGAVLNLQTTPIKGQERALLGTVPSSLAGIWNWERGDKRHPWAKIYEEFLSDGGATGYRDQYASLEDRAKAIQRELGQTGLRNATGIKQVLDLLSDYNTAIENSIRLAAYKTARDAGISRAQAAELAKDVTVNFNRKGARSGLMASLYAFFNSAVQGTERTLRVLRNPATGKLILGGGVALGALNAALGMLLLGDDWDEIPEFERSKHLILPLPWTDQKYVKIPYQLGYNALPNIGRRVVEMAVYRDQLGDRALGLLEETLDAFNPVGSSTMLGMISPSVTDPMLELATNENSFGRKIAREDFSALAETPGWTRARAETAAPFKAAAYAANWLTAGGKEYEKGFFSPTPEHLSYAFGVATGGLGRESDKIISFAEGKIRGDSMPAYKIPVVSRFYGEAGGDSVLRGKYFDAIKKINAAEFAAKRSRTDGNFGTDYEREAALASISRTIQNQISALNKERQAETDKARREELDLEIKQWQERLIEEYESVLDGR